VSALELTLTHGAPVYPWSTRPGERRSRAERLCRCQNHLALEPLLKIRVDMLEEDFAPGVEHVDGWYRQRRFSRRLKGDAERLRQDEPRVREERICQSELGNCCAQLTRFVGADCQQLITQFVQGFMNLDQFT
jgi:hypothetical protein